jgi:integrase
MMKRTKTASAALDSAPKRARLASRKTLYWVSVGGSRGGQWLGYRKPRHGPGAWVAKFIADGVRAEARIGEADDAGCSAAALGYPAAVAAALSWCKMRGTAIHGPAKSADPTVAEIVRDYIAFRTRRSDVRGKDAARRLTKHVLGDDRRPAARLAGVKLAKLTADYLRAWRAALPAKLKPATVNRLLNDLRAALARAHDGEMLPQGLRVALKAEADATEARPVRPLGDGETRALIAAAMAVEAHFGRFVLALAATGLRGSQVARLRVRDVQGGEKPRLFVPPSLKGRSTKPRRPIPVPIDAATLAALLPTTRDATGQPRDPDALLLTTHEGLPWSTSLLPRLWRRALSLADLRSDILPYDLRHTSIVRQLLASVPIRLVAQAHDTSVAMIERHYARFISADAEDVLRGTLRPLVGQDAATGAVVGMAHLANAAAPRGLPKNQDDSAAERSVA